MKKVQLFVLVFFILIGSSHATVRTVSNDPAGGAQYSSLQAAYNAAVNGDTLLLEGTNIDYGLTNAWAKSLVVIGIGFNPQKQSPRLTRILNASGFGRFELAAGANGSKFYGIFFTGNYANQTIHLNSTVSNILFENCKFLYSLILNNQSGSNWLFRNCIFDFDNSAVINFGGINGVYTNWLIANCVFDGYIEAYSNQFASIIITNSIFLSSTINAFNGLYFATISNNIFMNRLPGGAFNSSYLNNLCRVAGTFPTTNGNISTNNIENQDPMFTTYTINQLYLTSHDYTLQSGSPAIATGTGGADIGVQGGGSGFSRFGEVLHNPIMRSVNIQNPFIAPNGTLNVDIQATKPHDN